MGAWAAFKAICKKQPLLVRMNESFKNYLAKKVLGSEYYHTISGKEFAKYDNRFAKYDNKLAKYDNKLAKYDKLLNHPTFPPVKMFTYMEDDKLTLEQKHWYINRQSFDQLHYWQDLDHPRTFNEKTNWYKLHYRDPRITDCIDKYKFKDFVRQTLENGDKYVVPLYGVYKDVSEIDFDALPEKFVLKSNWGSGSRHVVLVRNKADLDIDELRLRMSTWILPWENVYYHTLDWGYKDIEPRIIAEKLIEDKIVEYKVFCFDGEPKFLYVAKNSAPGEKNQRDFYTTDWEWLPVKRHGANFDERLPKPKNLETILDLSRKLSASFPHVRVDIVDTKSGLFAEEMTFYTGSGQWPFNPPEWDLKFGEYFNLPTKNLV